MTSPINNEKECNFSKFSDYIELGGVADSSACFAIMQKDANRLEKVGNRNLMQFNKWKCKIPNTKGEQIHSWAYAAFWPAKTQL